MGSSVTIGGTAVKVQQWPKPSITPAILWTQDAAGYKHASDRGASQDIYESEILISETDANINALRTTLDANREGITLSAFNTEIFAPNVDHTGSISCSIVDFGVRQQKMWAGTTNNIQDLTLRVRAISPTILGTSPSLSTLRLVSGWSGDHSWEVGKVFSMDQTASYGDFRSDVGLFTASFSQTKAQAQAILAYLLTTARSASVALPTFSSVVYPFGIKKGTGPFNCKITGFEIARANLNRWNLQIAFEETP